MNLTSKNKLLILIVLIITASAFFFELNKPKKNNNKITFWQYWSGTEKEPLEFLVNKFNQDFSQDYGFEVEMLSISMPRKKILMSMAGGVSPDLVLLDSDMVADFALRDALSSLDEIPVEAFTDIYIEMLKIKGKQFALPLMPNVDALHINKSLLNKLGYSIPQSLDEIVALQKKLNADQAIAWHPSWPPWGGRLLPVLFGGTWASPCNEENKNCVDSYTITANSKENIEAWTWVEENFVKTIQAGKLASYTEGFSSYQSPDNPFYKGKIILENNGVWEKTLAKIFAPEMEVAITAFPGKIDKASYATADALAIPQGAKKKKQAQAFMQWLLRQENIEHLALAQGKFSPLKIHSKEFFKLHKNPYINIFIDLAQSPNVKFFPQLNFSNRYKREIKNAYERVVKGQISAKDSLDQLQASISGKNF